MSDLRIGLVAEGDTDAIVIEASLKAILKRPLILTTIQPDLSRAFGGDYGPHGGGWPGVYRWCRQIVSMGSALNGHPSLTIFDLIIIHVDADIASKSYADANISDMPANNLPCEKPCPPPSATVNEIKKVIKSWLGIPLTAAIPKKWIMCIPSKCIEAWLIPVRYQNGVNSMLRNLECNANIMVSLSQRPLKEGQRLVKGNKKIKRVYMSLEKQLTEVWVRVTNKCTTAKSFADGHHCRLMLNCTVNVMNFSCACSNHSISQYLT